MKLSHSNIEQAIKDISKYDQYVSCVHDIDKTIIPKTFKEAFGYEIILYLDGRFELRGERFDK